MTIIKIVSRLLADDRVEERVFVGPDEEHLQLAGTLVFRVGEWQLFGAARLFANTPMADHLRVLSVGGDQVVADLMAFSSSSS